MAMLAKAPGALAASPAASGFAPQAPGAALVAGAAACPPPPGFGAASMGAGVDGLNTQFRLLCPPPSLRMAVPRRAHPTSGDSAALISTAPAPSPNRMHVPEREGREGADECRQQEPEAQLTGLMGDSWLAS
jgi:hypothetical protein